MKGQKKWELLKFAYDNYSKGTKFIGTTGYNPLPRESSGDLRFSEDGKRIINFPIGSGIIYDSETEIWAEIVNPKISVKVENEKEFHALMKYYDSLGLKWNGGSKPTDKTHLPKYPNNIGFENYFQHTIEQLDDFKVIPFSGFAKEHNIKLPLIKSEDGVWLYEGDDYACVKNLHGNGWKYCYDGEPLKQSHFVLIESEICKAFSTKQSALDWIEAQKPKEIEIEIGCIKATITKNGVSFDGAIQFIMTDSLCKITKAIQELS